MKLDPRNLGVLLRRTLNDAYPGQRAEVEVADLAADGGVGGWRSAGVRSLAGSNTCYDSNPKAELDPSRPIFQPSNRRFHDDEFQIPRDLTKGRSAVRVWVRLTPEAAYSVVLPDFDPPR